MKIGILTIGNELMNGRIADANSSFIAREMNAQGWTIEAMMSVGDDEEAIKTRLHYLLAFTDAVICTGGLGPTVDDITTAAVARAFGLPLVMEGGQPLAVAQGRGRRLRLGVKRGFDIAGAGLQPTLASMPQAPSIDLPPE